MFEPEYRAGLRVLVGEIGLLGTLRVAVPALFRSIGMKYKVSAHADEPKRTKAEIKDHFRLLALIYTELKGCYGIERAGEVIQRVMLEGGRVFFRGFTPLGPDENLRDFAIVYQNFERRNIVFDVVEATERRFEIVIRRCLVFEAFDELGAADLSQWMCDIAFEYFSSYHPRMRYEKDRMIARGDSTCHEVFSWQE